MTCGASTRFLLCLVDPMFQAADRANPTPGIWKRIETWILNMDSSNQNSEKWWKMSGICGQFWYTLKESDCGWIQELVNYVGFELSGEYRAWEHGSQTRRRADEFNKAATHNYYKCSAKGNLGNTRSPSFIYGVLYGYFCWTVAWDWPAVRMAIETDLNTRYLHGKTKGPTECTFIMLNKYFLR